MATPHDAPETPPFEYDALAEVSHHGSSYFDFYAHQSMFGPSVSPSHNMHSPNLSSPLADARPSEAAVTSLELSSPVQGAHAFGDSALHGEATTLPPTSDPVASQAIATTAALATRTANARDAKLHTNTARNSSASKKKRAALARQTQLSARQPNGFSNQSRPALVHSQLNQSESYCTIDPSDATPASKPTLQVSPPIRKVDRRGRPGRGNASQLPVVMDASAEGTASVSASADGTTGLSPSANDDLEPGKDVHNSHTRRCRAKVNTKFQELLSILPTPPPKTGVKHKAQILDYTIRVFREIYAKKLNLEAELALSSRAQLNMWVDSKVAPAKCLADILNPFMSLICTKENWQYAETWVPAVPTTPISRKTSSSQLFSSDASQEGTLPDQQFDSDQSVSCP